MERGNTIGSRIEKLRKKIGLTQADLAKKVDVKRETVVQWESNTRDLKTAATVKLADVLGVTCDFVLRGVEAENVDVHKDLNLSDKAILVLRRDQSSSGVINALLEQQYSVEPYYFDAPDEVRYSVNFDFAYDLSIPVALEAIRKYLANSYNKEARYSVAELEEKGNNFTSVWPYQDVGYEVLERVMLDNIANGIKAIKERAEANADT